MCRPGGGDLAGAGRAQEIGSGCRPKQDMPDDLPSDAAMSGDPSLSRCNEELAQRIAAQAPDRMREKAAAAHQRALAKLQAKTDHSYLAAAYAAAAKQPQ